MSKSKKWWIVAGVVVVVGLGLGGWQLISSQQDAVADAPVSVETAVVRRDTLVVMVEGTGRLAPRAEVSLAFNAGGRVAEVLVEEERVVEAGQLLVRLDADELVLQVARAETALASAEGQLAQLLAAPQPEEVAAQEANLAAMQGQVSAAVANRDQVTDGPSEAQIAAARVQVASAEMEHRTAVINYDRTDKNDEDRKEQARYDLWAAEVALAAAQTQLDDLLAGADTDEVRAAQANVANAVAQRDAAQAQLDLLLAGPTAEQVQATEAAVDQARVSLDQARLSLEQATLAAPMDGTVTSLGVELGEMVSPGQPVVVLSGLTELEVEVNLDETDVARVAVGQEAQVSVDAFPGVEMTGKVTYIAPKADVASGVVLFPVTVRLMPSDHSAGSSAGPSIGPSAGSGQDSGRGSGQDSGPGSVRALPVRAGMTADVEITTASQEDALIVPLRAVHIEDGLAYVDRVVGDQIERVAVALGLTTDTEAEITRGLSEGDVVSVVAASTQSSTMPEFGPGRMFRGGN